MKIVIVGGGEVGFNIAKRLVQENKDVVIVEFDPEKVKKFAEEIDAQIILGSGSNPAVLKEAGIESAEMLICVANSDEVNIVASFIAHIANPEIIKIARIRNNELAKVFDSAKQSYGLDFCINPEQVASESIFKIIQIPGSTEVVDFAKGKIKLVAFHIQPNNKIIGKKLSDFFKQAGTEKILITSIVRGNKVIIPRGDAVIKKHDTIYIVLEPSKLKKIMSFFGYEDYPVTKKVMIAGTGNMAINLARKLEAANIDVKMLEKDYEKCATTAEYLNKSVVICADATDKSILEEENIADVDVFVAATDDESTNILSSMQAKNMGVKRVISIVNRMEFAPVISAAGVDVIISPRMMAASSILQFVRKGIILSVTEIRGEMAEAIEFVALDDSPIINKPLMEIKFPKGSLIGAIERNGEIIIPTGNDIIRSGDKVFIIALTSAVSLIEKIIQKR
ncbi:MAG: Trk system potassium transporter TrkA [Pseudomonadota bacterium]